MTGKVNSETLLWHTTGSSAREATLDDGVREATLNDSVRKATLDDIARAWNILYQSDIWIYYSWLTPSSSQLKSA